MSLTRKIAHNTLIQLTGKIFATLLGVLTVAVMTRYLGQIGFGQYSTITAYLQIFAILVDLGLSMTVVRMISDPQNDQTKIFNNLFTIRLLSSLIFLGLAPLSVIFFPYSPLIKFGIAVASLSFFFSALNQILIGLFQKELKMLAVTIAEVSGRLILLLLVILAAFLNYGLLFIVLAVSIGSLATLLINYLFALKYVKISLAFNLAIWKKIMITAWPLALSIAFNLVYFKADTLVLSLYRTQAEVGLYSAPYRVLEILVNFIFMFMGIILPILTLYWASQKINQFKEIFQKIFEVILIITVPMVCGTLLIAKNLMVFIAGADFSQSGVILQMLIFATAVIFINSLYGYTVIAIDKQKQVVWIYLIDAILALAGYIITIPIYGYYGAAIFTIISEVVILASNIFIVTKTVKFWPSLKILPKILAASLIMSALLWLIQGQNVILQLITATIIYFMALYLFKGIDKKLILDIVRFKSEPEQAKIEGDFS